MSTGVTRPASINGAVLMAMQVRSSGCLISIILSVVLTLALNLLVHGCA